MYMQHAVMHACGYDTVRSIRPVFSSSVWEAFGARSRKASIDDCRLA